MLFWCLGVSLVSIFLRIATKSDEQWGKELPDTTVGSPHDGRTAEGRSNMLDWIITAGGVGLFAVLLFFWVRWTEMEHELFANGNGRYLE